MSTERARSYRDLLIAKADGQTVSEEDLRVLRQEEELLRASMAYPRAVQDSGLQPAHFEGADYRIAWSAVMRVTRVHQGDGPLRPENVLAEMRRSGEARFAAGAGALWMASVQAQPPTTVEYALEILVPQTIQRHQMKRWRNRFGELFERVDKDPDTLGLYQEILTETHRVATSPDGGRLGETMEEIALLQTTTAGYVPTGIPQIDDPAGGGLGRGDMCVIGGGTNSGKCLREGTIVRRYDGSVRGAASPVEEIRPDDLLMGPDGQPRRVLATSRGHGAMYEVRPKDGGARWQANAQHLLTLVRCDRSPNKARDVAVEEFLQWSDADRRQMRMLRRDTQVHAGTLYANLKPFEFEVLDAEEHAPYYGFELDGDQRFLLGDFTVTHNSYACQRLLRNQARMNRPCLYVSVEDPKLLMLCRMLADYSSPRLPPVAFLRYAQSVLSRQHVPGAVSQAQWDTALYALTQEQQGRVYYAEARKWSCSQICSLIRRHRYMAKVDLVVVDYLQAIQPDEQTSYTNRTQEVARIVAQLKKCAGDCGVALVLMSQYARDEYREGQEPSINACKYAGDIENEAEILVLLWRDDEDRLHAKIPKVKWAKARDLRYLVDVDPHTGTLCDWQDDLSPRAAAPARGGRRGAGAVTT